MKKITLFIISISIFCYILLTVEKIFSKNSKIAIVTGQDVNIRLEPDIKSKVIFQLPIAHTVEILKINNDEIEIGKIKGKWVFIDTRLFTYKNYKSSNDKSARGWIFDHYLAYEEYFSKVTSWSYKKIYFGVGDYNPTYFFNKDGSFIKQYNLIYFGGDNGDSKAPWKECKKKGGYIIQTQYLDQCNIKGQLYRYKNIIKGFEDYFIIDSKNRLCSTVCGFDFCEECVEISK